MSQVRRGTIAVRGTAISMVAGNDGNCISLTDIELVTCLVIKEEK